MTSLYLKSGALLLLRDALRLVLAGYLAASVLWALGGFVATFIKPSAAPGCQAAVATASAFDQLARVLLQEFLFWGIKCDIKASITVLLPQAILLLRLALGGVFVGFQRPQYKPTCVGKSLLVPIAVALISTDVAIVLMLLVRASSVGLFRDMQEKTHAWPRSRALLLTLLALSVWTAVSIRGPRPSLPPPSYMTCADERPHDLGRGVLRSRRSDSASRPWLAHNHRYAFVLVYIPPNFF